MKLLKAKIWINLCDCIVVVTNSQVNPTIHNEVANNIRSLVNDRIKISIYFESEK